MKLKSSETIFDIEKLKNKKESLEKETFKEDFWQNNVNTQNILKEKTHIEKKLEKYEEIRNTISGIDEMIPLILELDDYKEAKLLLNEFDKLKEKIEDLKTETLLSGKYDDSNAILTIHAGTGGTEAMDWAEMLLRMYLRYAEAKEFKVNILDIQNDTVAGIKSATIEVKGVYAYGFLKGEHGVHRLVRISPFNAAGKRQTSFASVEVIPMLNDDIEINLNNEDLKIDTYRASGAGGQHVNTTDSAIRITHLPTGVVVTCQNERSQIKNKETAMKVLVAKLTLLAEEKQKESINELKGESNQIAWGSQIRSYIFQPYTMVKDHRTGIEIGDVNGVMDGDLTPFIRAILAKDAKDKRSNN